MHITHVIYVTHLTPLKNLISCKVITLKVSGAISQTYLKLAHFIQKCMSIPNLVWSAQDYLP